MKYLTFLLLFLGSFSFAQKQGNIWPIAHTYGLPEATQINFNYTPAVIEEVEREYSFRGAHSSICDESGNLLMLTNGLWITNKSGDVMENSDNLNAGDWASASGDWGYPVDKGSFFLQKPNDENLYYLFHMFIELTGGANPLTRFYYTLIDMSYNDGLGKVIEKNVPLLTGDHLLNYNQATAVRHANGRDWWIIVPNHMAPEYFRFLLTPDGIEGPWTQEIGFKEPTDDWWIYFNGQRVFSSDGSRFADYDFLNYTQVFDFDRCTGLLSNPVLINHNLDPVLNNATSGIAFSPSGRFLYMTRTNNGYSLYQYDLEADDILASEIEIAACPLVGQQADCSFNNILLAPDEKIYISLADSISYHVIHEPDSLGLACDFEQGGLVFPLANPNSWFPYFPNYRLGAFEGSVCDSIVSGNENVFSERPGLLLSPNPANDYAGVSVNLPVHQFGQNIELVLLNPLGQVVEVREYDGAVQQYRFDVTALPPGLYSIALRLDGRVSTAMRLSIVR
jgi:hypothetical protein